VCSSDLGGGKTPGVVEVSATFALASNKSKPSGEHGARVTVTGRDPQEIDVTLYLWTPEQWVKWQALADRVCGSDKRTATAFDVYHPGLASLNIRSAIVLSRSIPQRGRVAGERSIRLRLVEHFPVPPAARRGTASGAAPATTTALASVNEALQSQEPSAFSPADANISLPSGEAATVGP
jgi:hypothetical protein